MLARALATIVAAAALVVIGSSTPASAGGDEDCWYETDPDTGEVKLVCEDTGGNGGRGLVPQPVRQGILGNYCGII